MYIKSWSIIKPYTAYYFLMPAAVEDNHNSCIIYFLDI